MSKKIQKVEGQYNLTQIRNQRMKTLQHLNQKKKGKYTVYKNNVYQITDIRNIHPGGAIIELAINKDCTQLVECYHPDSAYEKVEKLLQKHFVMALPENQQLPICDNTFFVALKKKVDARMKQLNLNRHSFEFLAIMQVLITVFLYFFFTYKLIYKNQIYVGIIYSIILGFLTGRLGLLMHMGSHNSISKYPLINALIQYCMDIIGGNSIAWRSQHVYSHHVAPNQKQTDCDCNIAAPMIRLHPQTQWKWFHVYQAPLIISALSVGTAKRLFLDVNQFIRTIYAPNEQDIFPTKKNWVQLIFFKVIFVVLHMILPAYNNGFLAVIGYNLILFLISAHYLYELFIVNHIQSGLVPEKNIHWSVKQIDGTVDWAPGSHFGNWVSGGLSHQVIHHVFPNITHWIYPYLVPTFRQTCQQFGLKYHTFNSFGEAWINMFKYLALLGENKVKISKKQ